MGFQLPTSTGWCRISEPSTRVLSQMVGLMMKNPMVESANNWLVVSTPLKNISQMGNLSQIVVKIKNI